MFCIACVLRHWLFWLLERTTIKPRDKGAYTRKGGGVVLPLQLRAITLVKSETEE